MPGNVHLLTRCDLCIEGPGAVELGCHYGVQFWRQSRRRPEALSQSLTVLYNSTRSCTIRHYVRHYSTGKTERRMGNTQLRFRLLQSFEAGLLYSMRCRRLNEGVTKRSSNLSTSIFVLRTIEGASI